MESVKSQALSRAVLILDCFTQEQNELGVREVARLVSLPSSVTGRLMQSLKELGLLTQNVKTRTYSLGPRVLTWAGVYLSTSDLRIIALPNLQELHHTTLETVSLYVLDGDERVCIERIESPHNVRIVARLGQRLPLYAGSAGKVLLAFMPKARCEEILSRTVLLPLTPSTIIDPNVLRGELEVIRQTGYAVSQGEWLVDASGVAAPIFDQNANIVAVLTISGPTQRFTPAALSHVIPSALQGASQISRRLGYRSQPIPQPNLPSWSGS